MPSVKPNILFLFSDQHNARCLSCAGHPDVKTPHLDTLARDGVRFGNAYANNPICTPSRISYLSGLMPSTHGYYGLYGPEPAAPMTSMFAYFRQHGYRTGALGKLHTPRHWIERDCQFVYDEFLEYPKYLEGAGLYEKNDNRHFTGKRDGEKSAIPYEHSCEMALAKQTIRFMNNEGEPKDRGDDEDPWFAWVSFSRPHQPYTPSEPFASMYPAGNITLPPVSGGEKPTVLEKREKISEIKLRRMVSAYLGLVSQVDDAIGKILNHLEQKGMLENTIIVYASDHGDYAGEHGLFEKKGGISYRAITRVPLIFRLPRVLTQTDRGTVLEEMIEAVDLFPTFCELVGIDPPNTVQGRSFAGLVTGENSYQHERQSALTENTYSKSLATQSYRYVANLPGIQKDELYNLEEDPWELTNKINDPVYSEIANSMLRELLDRVVRARKPVISASGGWHEHIYDLDGRIDLTQSKMNPYW